MHAIITTKFALAFSCLDRHITFGGLFWLLLLPPHCTIGNKKSVDLCQDLRFGDCFLCYIIMYNIIDQY